MFGVDIPDKKKIYISLTYIFGVGPYVSRRILALSKVDMYKPAYLLTDEEVARIRIELEKKYKIEGNLKQEIYRNVKRLIDIRCYRGLRHKRKLPVRGQRTHSNARSSRKRHIDKI